MPFPFPCSPVIRECSWKKTHIEKKKICLTTKTLVYVCPLPSIRQIIIYQFNRVSIKTIVRDLRYQKLSASPSILLLQNLYHLKSFSIFLWEKPKPVGCCNFFYTHTNTEINDLLYNYLFVFTSVFHKFLI